MKQRTFDLLFKESTGNKGTPLFNSQADLARVINNEVEPEEFSSEVSLKSYINRVLKGERPASDSLKSAILEAIKIRISPDVSMENIRSEFLISLSDPISKQLTKGSDVVPREKFIEAVTSPGHHVFITDYPIEILSTDFSTKIKNAILKNIGINERKWPSKGRIPQSSYEYYVGDFDKAIRLWQELSDSLELALGKYRMDHNEAKLRLYSICRKPYEYIQIFRSFPPIASHNLYLYNIEGTDEQTLIFHFFRSRNDIKIIELPVEAYSSIRENVYSYLRGFLRDEELIREKHKDIALEVKKFGKINQFSPTIKTEEE